MGILCSSGIGEVVLDTLWALRRVYSVCLKALNFTPTEFLRLFFSSPTPTLRRMSHSLRPDLFQNTGISVLWGRVDDLIDAPLWSGVHETSVVFRAFVRCFLWTTPFL